MDIVDKRVVVTGAASGIGKALAVEFKNEKAKDVVLADLNDEVLKVVGDEKVCEKIVDPCVSTTNCKFTVAPIGERF